MSLVFYVSYGNPYYSSRPLFYRQNTSSGIQHSCFSASEWYSGSNTSSLATVWQVGVIKRVQLPNPFTVLSGSDEVSYGRAAPVGTPSELWEEGESFLPSGTAGLYRRPHAWNYSE